MRSLGSLRRNSSTARTTVMSPTVVATIGTSYAFAVLANKRTCISTRSALVSERMTSNISFW